MGQKVTFEYTCDSCGKTPRVERDDKADTYGWVRLWPDHLSCMGHAGVDKLKDVILCDNCLNKFVSMLRLLT